MVPSGTYGLVGVVSMADLQKRDADRASGDPIRDSRPRAEREVN